MSNSVKETNAYLCIAAVKEIPTENEKTEDIIYVFIKQVFFCQTNVNFPPSTNVYILN